MGPITIPRQCPAVSGDAIHRFKLSLALAGTLTSQLRRGQGCMGDSGRRQGAGQKTWGALGENGRRQGDRVENMEQHGGLSGRRGERYDEKHLRK